MEQLVTRLTGVVIGVVIKYIPLEVSAACLHDAQMAKLQMPAVTSREAQ